MINGTPKSWNAKIEETKMTEMRLEDRISQLQEGLGVGQPRASHVRELEWLRELLQARKKQDSIDLALKLRAGTATHTFAVMELSEKTYEEIFSKIAQAGYDHALIDGDGKQLIDMHGIAVMQEDLVKSDRTVLIEVVDALKKLNKANEVLDWTGLIRHVETHLYGEPSSRVEEDSNAAG